MPLTSTSPLILHLAQNISLLALSLLFTPLLTISTLLAHLISPYTSTSKSIQNAIATRQRSNAPHHTILITGLSMSKGLFLARAFYKAGHTVIGADFEPHRIPASGRFSRAVKRFYRLPSSQGDAAEAYGEALVEIIEEEKIDLWVSCSGVASAMDDARAAEMVEAQTGCKAVQFDTELTQTLHEKDSFIRQAGTFGLNVPETHAVASVEEGMAFLFPSEKTDDERERRYIMKPIGMDDARRADMTLLPLSSPSATKLHLERLGPSTTRPFVLQHFIKGEEYCTHSLIIHGRIAAFTSCPSAELLMHYSALPPQSTIAYAMQSYTQKYVSKLGNATGHFSIDFMLDTSGPRARYERDWEGSGRLYPIECNPRAHTAVVLFEGSENAMVDGYLRALDERAFPEGEREVEAVVPTPAHARYWIGHDLLTLVIMPVLSLATLGTSPMEVVRNWLTFGKRLVSPRWRDGTFEVWDPWPFWWLYVVYWPGRCVMAIWNQEWWSRANVSTGKMFRC